MALRLEVAFGGLAFFVEPAQARLSEIHNGRYVASDHKLPAGLLDMWSTLTAVATLLALLIAVLPLFDLFVVPQAKRRLAEYVNPDLRPSSDTFLNVIRPAYDTAIRFQAQIFDVRFLSVRFFLRSALITLFFVLMIGLSHAAISPLFRLSLRNSVDVGSPQFSFFVIVIVGVFIADYICAGQTRFFLSLVKPTSKLLNFALLLYANLCVGASIFASVVGLAATIGAFFFDYMWQPLISVQVMTNSIVTVNAEPVAGSDNRIVLGVDQTQSEVAWIFEDPEASAEWMRSAKDEQRGLLVRRLVARFSYKEDNALAYSPSNMLGEETGGCPTSFSIKIFDEQRQSVPTEIKMTVSGKLVDGTIDLEHATARAEIRVLEMLRLVEFPGLWAAYARYIGDSYINLMQSVGLRSPEYISPILQSYHIFSARCGIGSPIGAAFLHFVGSVSYGGWDTTRYDVPLVPLLYAGIATTILIHGVAFLIILGRGMYKVGRFVLPSFPWLRSQTERPFTLIAVMLVIYGVIASVLWVVAHLILEFLI